MVIIDSSVMADFFEVLEKVPEESRKPIICMFKEMALSVKMSDIRTKHLLAKIEDYENRNSSEEEDTEDGGEVFSEEDL